MNPTQVFQILGRTEPFFTVSSFSRYRTKNMRSQDQLRFWQEGRDSVAELLDSVGQQSFDSVLDYGCGVGRLLRWMLPHAVRAYGVDVSTAMLRKASQLCPGATVMDSDQWLHTPPLVEFSYSTLVFQHVPQGEGLVILDRLLDHTQRVCALHILVDDHRRWLTKLLFRLSFVPPFAGFSNRLRGRSWNEPRVPMFCWNADAVRTRFERAGFRLSLHPFSECADRWESYLFLGRR